MSVHSLVLAFTLLAAPDTEVSLEEMVARSVTFPVPDAHERDVFVEKADNLDPNNRCKLPVRRSTADAVIDDTVVKQQPACELVLNLLPGESVVVHHGDRLAAYLVLRTPSAAGDPLRLEWVRESKASTGPRRARIQLAPPEWVPWLDDRPRFYARLGGRWIRGEWKKAGNGGAVQVSPAEIIEPLGSGGPVTVYVASDTLGTRSVVLAAVDAAPASPPTPTSPGKLETACDDPDIRNEARAAIGRPSGSVDVSKWSARKLLLGNWYYLVCYDLTDPSRPKTITLTEPKEVATILERTYDRSAKEQQTLLAGHEIVVVVWGAPGTDVDIDIDGNPDWGTTIHIPEGTFEAKRVRATELPHKVEVFAPRGGEYLELSVTGKQKPAPDKPLETVFELEHTRRLESLYRGAIRVGLALSWSPWDRTYEARTGSGGVRYIAVGSGADRVGSGRAVGLLDAELVFGYSVFTRLVPSLHRGAVFAWYFGAGLVKAGATGVSVLNSVHTGPEIAIGRNVGIAFTASLRRTRWLENDYRVGQVLRPDEDVPTRFGVTPVFSILVSLQPAVFKAAGKVASERYGLFGGGT